MADEKKEEPEKKSEKVEEKPKKEEPRQPKPQSRFEKLDVNFTGEKGKYLLSVWTFDQYGKPIGNVPIKIFYGNEPQPRHRLVSNTSDAIEFMIEFSSEKLRVVVNVGHKKEEKELEGPEQKSSPTITEEERNMSWWDLAKKTISETFAKWRKK